MSDYFVICNQLGQFWGKKKRWVDGHKPRRVLTCKHEDEAVNLLVELSARDVELRGEVVAATLSEKGVPQVEPSEHRIIDEDDLETPAEDPTSLASPGDVPVNGGIDTDEHANGDVDQTKAERLTSV